MFFIDELQIVIVPLPILKLTGLEPFELALGISQLPSYGLEDETVCAGGWVLVLVVVAKRPG